MKKRPTYAPRQCKDCPTIFAPGSAIQVRCKDCQQRRKRMMWRARELQRSKDRKARRGLPAMPAGRRYLYSADFLLALPEMRREFERQVGEGFSNIHIEGKDETYIPDRRTA